MKKIVLFLITSLLFTVVLLSVKNSYSAFIKNVQTSLEVTTPKLEAVFLPGEEFNAKIKQLAGNTNATQETNDTNITSVIRSNVLTITPTIDNIVSANTSSFPIYAWFNSGVLYYYTEVERPKTNSNSRGMFRNLVNATSIDTSTFDTSGTTDFDSMFFEDLALTTLNLSNFDTSSAIYMGGMFYKCHSLTSLNVSSFDTSEVTQMHLMFYETKKLQSLDISNFDMSNVSIISNMMDKMIDLKELKTPDIYPNDTSKAITLPKKMYDSNSIEYTLLYKGSSPISPTKTIIKEGYEVTFDADLGSVNPISKVLTYDNTTYGSLPTPTKTGYTFLGWNGKNLLNMNAWLSSFSAGYHCSVVAKGNNAITLTATSDDCYTNSWNSSYSYAIKVKPNTTYTLSWNIDSSNVKVRNFVFVNDVPSSPYMTYVDEVGATKLTFTTTSDAEFITFRLGVSLSGETITYSNLQLEENSDVTEYEPYYVTSSTSLVQKEDHTLKAIYVSTLTNNVIDYSYNGTTGSDGSVQKFIAPETGIYELEIWGAQGGTYHAAYPGGYGGYSTGQIKLLKGQELYINVGGQGSRFVSTAPVLGGYNGGGTVTQTDGGSSSGGGATSITSTNRGLLSSYENYLSEILIVAGAGGGTGREYSYSGITTSGGHGGGYLGNSTITWTSRITDGYSNIKGGGQTPDTTSQVTTWSDRSNTIGSFGQGGNTMGEMEYSSAGGGGFYGGTGGFGAYIGAGGSGYIGNTNLINKSMYCYDCAEDLINDNTFTISTTGTSEYKDTVSCPDGYSSNPVSKCAKAGHGHARITLITAGESWDYAYTGGTRSFTVPISGTYKLETWGAQGGSVEGMINYAGAMGGHSTGNIQLSEGQKIYITVGGKGTSIADNNVVLDGTGYNGGGNITSQQSTLYYGSGGGGATHIATSLSATGLLSDYSNNISNILLVSGGGGGSSTSSTSKNNATTNGSGGSGGGFNGTNGSTTYVGSDFRTPGTGGTQTSPGTSDPMNGMDSNRISTFTAATFGSGCQATGDYDATSYMRVSGGGGYYGGGCGIHSGGGGGSGYMKSTLSNKKMYCYGCQEDLTNASTFTVSTTGSSAYKDTTACPSGYSSSAISKCAKAGNGYARITLVSLD